MIKRERQNAPGRTDRFRKEGGIFVGEWVAIAKAHQTQSLPLRPSLESASATSGPRGPKAT